MRDLVIPEMGHYLSEERTDQYYEAVLADLIGQARLELSVLRVGTWKWAEIDTVEDLYQAEKLLPAPAISRS